MTTSSNLKSCKTCEFYTEHASGTEFCLVLCSIIKDKCPCEHKYWLRKSEGERHETLERGFNALREDESGVE